MSFYLCFTIRFLQPYSHGRGDGDEPEWPPSPLRFIQSLISAGAGRWNERIEVKTSSSALKWLSEQEPPEIVAANAIRANRPYRLYVPDNVTDKVAASWARGRNADIAEYRTEKDVRPMCLMDEAVHYLYPLPDGQCPYLDVLTVATRSITHLGWGVDMAVGDASMITGEQVAALSGLRWRPSPVGGVPLRTPKTGTLDDLIRKHNDFLNRVSKDGFRPVPPLRVFDVIRYRCQDQPFQRPYRIFELRNIDGSRFRYPHRRLIHIAGMVRHLAIEAMRHPGNRPRGVDDNWLDTYIAGHSEKDESTLGEMSAKNDGHRRLSYLPLPSVGHEHADPGVRRVMICAPVGDDAWLGHVAKRLAGQALQPVRGDEFGDREPPMLVPMYLSGDGVTRCYTMESSVWHSFTPVILPGHGDHKPKKIRALIERALIQSGVEQPCDFEWSAFSRFRKSFSAHKYGKDKQPQGYYRPGYLLSQTAVHLTLRFHDGTEQKNPVAIPGPLAIGAGRHCGLGLFAAINERSMESDE